MRGPRPDSGPAPSLLYDTSRLCTRVLQAAPNGIDRLDALLGRGLLADAGSRDTAAALVFGWGGPRLVHTDKALTALARAERMWREAQGAAADADALARLLPRLTASDTDPSGPEEPAPSSAPLVRRLRAAFEAVASLGLWGGLTPAVAAAPNAVYLNVSHFPLDWPTHVAWLARRPDVRPVVMVHDLLPIDHPEWFWRGEGVRHRARLAFLARRGAAAIVTSRSVEERLQAEMVRTGRRDLPVFRAAPPVSQTFRTPRRPDPRLAATRYFVVCGTIEPRKNHRLLLRLWRRLAKERRGTTPKLVVVGKRGWLCGEVLAEMRALSGAGHLVLAHGLASGAYRTLLDGSLALLAPSLAEGYGLPVAEAQARGVQVVASDIPPFREQGVDVLIDPNDEAGWYDAITALADAGPPTRRPLAPGRLGDEGDYLGAVRTFLQTLA